MRWILSAPGTLALISSFATVGTGAEARVLRKIWTTALPRPNDDATRFRGPDVLGLVNGAPRDAIGFDVREIAGRGTGVVADIPASPRSRSLLILPMAPLARVRVSTARLREDGRSVTLKGEAGEEPITLAKPGAKLEGKLDSIEDDALILSVRGIGRVRVRQEDVVGLEVRKPGSTALGVIGGFAGMGAGLLATALVCGSVDVCDSVAPLWLGMALGAGLGAAAAGGGEWQPVPFLQQRRVSLVVQPRPRGTALGLRVSF